ncbi:MAG: GDP-mannose 4,6-dehydratase [Candidatus Spechtbacteria bacterium RIFCSPHIGHO2_02_FULL_43_15b]|uniref:GDP-mannose 4,6-dehydratase n=1 Tax=Candidatus Spechtbacteria bacterium RIFCSPHIGHO2_01_FULL_43_30 TaxID=1802158 RepID=A0A1G2H4E2_9BACT|nr:MAG: GDP-mannose 4,6-dehydratase [Candidatus Spechtbacteria bacterium RIFCSPHIGHO2_01_FULL_43_30]OGZ59020.1 MAG: GDP-mannose 4,6-dehydratase [Candidatus Spechtbacteria bacterium RIFCSPHIGHO2_02_FULL_43_15b]
MEKTKIALITGCTGQDGSYLAEFLLKKGYEVHGIRRRSSIAKLDRLSRIHYGPHAERNKFFLHYGDITDSASITQITKRVKPDEVYNLAAQSHVRVSFDTPEYTANTDALGPLRVLEAIRTLGFVRKTKFYQASTSEMFGNPLESPQHENTPFFPRSPYGIAKLYAHLITANYREAYNMFACSGILFNHESPRRGESFVTRKITQAAIRIVRRKQDKLYLGNLYAKRDWGYAKEYVEAMWLMLQQKKPKDYVIATGENHTVKEFAELAFRVLDIDIEWQGQGISEKGINKKNGKIIVEIDPYYFRPTEVENLVGNASMAKKELGWAPKTKFQKLVNLIMAEEVKNKDL